MCDLLPCPFCGNTKSLMVEHLDGTILHPAYCVKCDNCGAASAYTDQDHIAAWNRRASPAVTPAVKVKPLVWEGHSDQERSGDYIISPSYGQGPKAWMLARGSKLIGWYDEKWIAKVAANGNHEAFLYSSLDVTTTPTLAEALELPEIKALVEAAKYFADWDHCWPGNISLGLARDHIEDALRRIAEAAQ